MLYQILQGIVLMFDMIHTFKINIYKKKERKKKCCSRTGNFFANCPKRHCTSVQDAIQHVLQVHATYFSVGQLFQ